MSGSTEKQSSTQASLWGPQNAALTTAFSGAQDAYGKAQTAQLPTDFVAQYTPEQLATYRSALGYANGSEVPNQNAATGGALSTAGTSATASGLNGLANYDPTKLNNASTIVDNANQYVKGQNIDAQVNDAMLNARQTARDVTLPGIGQNAALTGNTNSSRTGIAEGLVERGLAEQAANLGGSLRSNAFKDGLTLASSNAAANNASSLGALNSEASSGINAANSGVAANSASINDKGQLLNLADTAGSGLRSSDQAYLDNLLKRYQAGISSPYDALNGLMGIVGTNNWAPGSTGTEKTTKTPSAFELLGGLMGGAGSLASTAGGLGWKPFA
jgi:hypothetical protein